MFKVGDKVKIISGAYAGMTGAIKSIIDYKLISVLIDGYGADPKSIYSSRLELIHKFNPGDIIWFKNKEPNNFQDRTYAVAIEGGRVWLWDSFAAEVLWEEAIYTQDEFEFVCTQEETFNPITDLKVGQLLNYMWNREDFLSPFSTMLVVEIQEETVELLPLDQNGISIEDSQFWDGDYDGVIIINNIYSLSGSVSLVGHIDDELEGVPLNEEDPPA